MAKINPKRPILAVDIEDYAPVRLWSIGEVLFNEGKEVQAADYTFRPLYFEGSQAAFWEWPGETNAAGEPARWVALYRDAKLPSEQEMLRQFRHYVETLFLIYPDLVLVSDNAAFDFGVLNARLRDYGYEELSYHRGTYRGNLYCINALDELWGKPALPDTPHDPVSDARAIGLRAIAHFQRLIDTVAPRPS